MKTLGVGMVGARYGARMHLANYAKLPCELVAVRGVCSRTKESGAALAHYFTEKLETKAGWNRPSCDEDWFRGFAQEIEDFVGAIRDGREPRSGIDLAVECVNVIYAAYQSAETGCRVTLT